MKVAVVGAGAVGSVVSYLLSSGGAEVFLYDDRKERVAEIQAKGVRLRGDMVGEVFPKARLPGEFTEPFDLIALACAAGPPAESLRPLSPYVHRETAYLSVQEGSAVDELRELVGDSRAGGALPWISAVESDGGEIEVEEFRSLVVGGVLPPSNAVFSELVEMADAVLPGKALLVGDLEREKWLRLRSAAAVSGLCAVLGGAPEEIRVEEEVDVLCREAAGECERLASSAGFELKALDSPWEDAVWRWIKPPLLRDLEAARKTEAYRLSGYLEGLARERGGSAPVHSALFSLIKEMETGRRRPGPDNIAELRRRIGEEKGMRLQ